MNTAVKNKKELIERILASGKQISSYGVKSLGIFGAFVRDEAKENSDVDFFIDFAIEYKTLKNFVGLADILQEITGRKVEIVTPQSLNKFLGKYIIQEVEYVSLAA
ncbi:MAG TPA: nucleotidyltransferase family protein [Saprospiraceae bacterium]|nr:nucleotidyltransferase family protein [Saprospiraceae bacterium]